MKKFIGCILLMLLITLCFAENPNGRLVPNKHWVYDALYSLALENGQTSLSDKQPQSVGALRAYFSDIIPDVLSAQGRNLYNQVQKFFDDPNFLVKEGFFVFDINARINLQGQYIHNANLMPRADAFLRYKAMPSLISVPLEMMFSSYIHLYMDFALKKNFWAATESYPYTNIPFSVAAFDFSFPQFAGLHIGNKFFSFSIGRGPLAVGKTLLGSMIISDTLDRFDFFSLAFFARKIRTDISVIEFEPTRFMFIHEIAFRPIKRLLFRAHEAVTVNSAFDPRYLNPFMIFHNFAGWNDTHLSPPGSPALPDGSPAPRVGTQLGIGAEYIPVSGLRLYAQFVMNQFQTLHERTLYPEAAGKIPNSLGGLFGIEYQHLVPIGRLTFSLEGIYANPWLYIMENKPISFFHSRREMLSTRSYENSHVQTWVGNPYGPDTIAGIFNIGLSDINKYSSEFSYRFIVKGENEELFLKAKQYYPANAAEATIKTPSGLPAYFHTLRFAGKYNILKNLSIEAALAWTIAHGKFSGHAVEISSALCYSAR